VNSATRPLQMMKRMNKRKVDGGYHTFGLVENKGVGVIKD
jgi:hypothetical protein